MENTCSNPNCAAPAVDCHDIKKDYKNKCDHWLKNNPRKENKENKVVRKRKTDLPWTGEAFLYDQIDVISRRSSPYFIGIIGKANAGKTTFLAMLYTLLLRGEKFRKFEFAGTQTIIAWDRLYHTLNIQQNKVAFPNPTPSEYHRLLHIALKDKNKGQLKDILFSDASGEVFTWWAKKRNAENAENAQKIYLNSDAFILFIDCEDLIKRKNLAKIEIIDLAENLKRNLGNRPLVAVWSKSDKKDDVHPRIKESLEDELNDQFSQYNYIEIDISNFSKEDPDEVVHKNNIAVVDWLLERIEKTSSTKLLVDRVDKNDLFLNYKGND
ncbi:TRAFAC clade GTPase domain-containing protein [Aureispira anguillae]|uniref:50S ribosome-binding GTPase n=1 Tax=Aureispira anguillae TaxID=2864201 RepID=A0A916DUB8_9BACT|nr:GTPase [Aureispira anguillae]BDS12400.1 50S ribosome-binding GTPase [Aureispira anguillae]